MLTLRRQFFRDSFVLGTLLATAVVLAWSWVIIMAIPEPRGGDESLVILHSTIYFGIQKLGEWRQLLLYPGIATAVAVAQTIIAYVLYERARFWSAVLVLSTFAETVIIFIVSVFLLSLNI